MLLKGMRKKAQKQLLKEKQKKLKKWRNINQAENLQLRKNNGKP